MNRALIYHFPSKSIFYFIHFALSSAFQDVPDYVADLASPDCLESKPLTGLRVGVIQETLGEGVDKGVISAVKAAASHLERLGSVVTEVSIFKCYLFKDCQH